MRICDICGAVCDDGSGVCGNCGYILQDWNAESTTSIYADVNLPKEDTVEGGVVEQYPANVAEQQAFYPSDQNLEATVAAFAVPDHSAQQYGGNGMDYIDSAPQVSQPANSFAYQSGYGNIPQPVVEQPYTSFDAGAVPAEPKQAPKSKKDRGEKNSVIAAIIMGIAVLVAIGVVVAGYYTDWFGIPDKLDDWRDSGKKKDNKAVVDVCDDCGAEINADGDCQCVNEENNICPDCGGYKTADEELCYNCKSPEGVCEVCGKNTDVFTVNGKLICDECNSNYGNCDNCGANSKLYDSVGAMLCKDCAFVCPKCGEYKDYEVSLCYDCVRGYGSCENCSSNSKLYYTNGKALCHSCATDCPNCSNTKDIYDYECYYCYNDYDYCDICGGYEEINYSIEDKQCCYDCYYYSDYGYCSCCGSFEEIDYYVSKYGYCCYDCYYYYQDYGYCPCCDSYEELDYYLDEYGYCCYDCYYYYQDYDYCPCCGYYEELDYYISGYGDCCYDCYYYYQDYGYCPRCGYYEELDHYISGYGYCCYDCYYYYYYY